MVCDVSIMRYAHNDNAETWITLAAATARALQPTEKQNEKGGEDRQPRDDDKQRGTDHSQYVEQRLRDLAEFERRANGKR